MAELLNPKEITLTDGKGNEKKFLISEFDCIFGRKVVFKYPTTLLPKVSEYEDNEKLMFDALKYCAYIPDGGQPIPLSTPDVIRNHCSDWEMLVKLEKELMKYNVSFFQDGRASTFFEQLAQMFHLKVLEMLTPSSEPSSPPNSPLSTS